MKSSGVATAICTLASVLLGFTVISDGGNVDFYRFPLTIAWLLLTGFALWSKSYSRLLAFIRHAWWLQLVMPFVLFALSVGLTDFYKPYPGRRNAPPAQVTPAVTAGPAKRP